MIPKEKKIAILHPGVNKKGGAVNMMILLGNLLQKRGNKVHLFTLSYNEKIFYEDIDFHVYILSKIKIAYKIRKYDYIFIGNSPMQFVGAGSKMFFGCRGKIFWWHHHFPWYYEKHTNTFVFLKRYLEKFSLYFIDELIANSLYIQKTLKDIYDLDSKILYPILDSYFLDYLPQKRNFDNYVIISYGRWVKGKNLKQIFTTYNLLKEKIPKLELILGGVGGELDFYKKQYVSDTHIKFLGMLDKKSIVDNLEKSNVFLFPSKVDSFGISPLESLSIGTPVVGFSGKGLTEIVKNRENGFLVNTPDEFTEKVFQILINKSLNTTLSENGLGVKSKFSQIKFIENLEKIF